MRKWFVFFVLVFIVSSMLIAVSADIGPKPSVDINIYYDSSKISDASFSAKMLSCVGEDYPENNEVIPQLNISEYDSSKDCYWKPAFMAWGGDCSDSRCHFGYMLPSEFKLAVYVPSLNKVFVTNEVSRENFDSTYKVELYQSGATKISETTSFMKKDSILSFIKALIITLVIELIVAFIFILVTKLPKRILISFLIANLISLPIVWFIFPLIGAIVLVIALSEIFAVIFEALFVYYTNKNSITLAKSFVLCLLANIASLIIGGFIMVYLSPLLY